MTMKTTTREGGGGGKGTGERGGSRNSEIGGKTVYLACCWNMNNTNNALHITNKKTSFLFIPA